MTGSFASGTTASLVDKNITKKNILLQWIKLSRKPKIKKFNKTDPQYMGNLIQNTISKIFRNKKSLQKRPSKIPKN